VAWVDARDAVLQIAAAAQSPGDGWQLQWFVREPASGLDAALLGALDAGAASLQSALGTATPTPQASLAWMERGLGGGDTEGGESLEQAFDRLREEIETQSGQQLQASVGTLAVSTSLSVGYVLWLARGGALLASLASSIPAWASMDPLPVLSKLQRRKRGRDDGDEADEGGIEEFAGRAEDEGMKPDAADRLERLFSRARGAWSGARAPSSPGSGGAAS
jgi:hypothetical protein